MSEMLFLANLYRLLMIVAFFSVDVIDVVRDGNASSPASILMFRDLPSDYAFALPVMDELRFRCHFVDSSAESDIGGTGICFEKSVFTNVSFASEFLDDGAAIVMANATLDGKELQFGAFPSSFHQAWHRIWRNNCTKPYTSSSSLLQTFHDSYCNK